MQQRRWLVVAGVAGLVLGAAIGAAGEETRTVTETETVVQTETKRVPVVRVRTVKQVRRVVRTHTVTVEAAAPVDSYDTYDDYDTPDYAGMNCSEIGHSFSVPPGSDPEHDADNDGLACESY